jgi:DNA-binding GntR family transcriptional regulator
MNVRMLPMETQPTNSSLAPKIAWRSRDGARGLRLKRLRPDLTVTARAYEALRQAIMAMDIYRADEDLRLDERRLAQQLGISRTPLRGAIARLEHEGLVKTVARRGIYVVRKSKAEIIEIITVWAALESMAARLATSAASDREIAALREFFAEFDGARIEAKLDEYSEANLRFHQRIIEMSHNALLVRLASSILIHMRAIRRRTIGEKHRFARSIVDHMNIIEALERRDTAAAEALVRDHALNLAAHVAANVHDLD